MHGPMNINKALRNHGVFWDIALSRLVLSYRSFGEACCLRIQVNMRKVQESSSYTTLKMESKSSSETSRTIDHYTRRHIPED